MSTIKSKENPVHVVQDTDLIPIITDVNNATPTPVSVTPPQLGILPTDENGNVLANVVLRKGTLASLLTISDAGDGEIATATDVDSLVVYHGSPSVGIPYSRNGVVARANAGVAFTLVPTATDVDAELNPVFNPDGIINNIDDIFEIPSNLPLVAGEEMLVEFDIKLFGTPGVAVGTNMFLSIQKRKKSDLTYSALTTKIIATSSSVSEPWVNYARIVISDFQLQLEGVNEIDALKFVLSHDSGGSISFFAEINMVIRELAA